jgi:hypothetical protein
MTSESVISNKKNFFKMKLKIIFGIFTVLVVAAFTSCQDGGTGLTKNVTGKAGELVVVISEDAWEGNTGKLIRETLAQEHLALPQDEPLFDLIKVPHEAFRSIFKTTRNILQTRISPNMDSSGITFQENLWASPQSIVTIQALNENEFQQIFEENKNKIMSYFLKAERDRLTMNYNRYYERGIFNRLDEKFGLTMKVAPGFQIATERDDFIWLRYETPNISQGIILYSFPYVSDSAFTASYQMKIRDSILRANVPGPTQGSYMATERRVEQVYNARPHNGNYATEMRGLWRLMNDFMGGPYISLAQLDIENQRVIVAYGYVYAPNRDKRNFVRQVEAMIYTLALNNQANNDKLNAQVSIDN